MIQLLPVSESQRGKEVQVPGLLSAVHAHPLISKSGRPGGEIKAKKLGHCYVMLMAPPAPKSTLLLSVLQNELSPA